VAEALRKVGRYEIIERVGRGGMGSLYRGRDPVLDRDVAIKLMHADFSDDENARPRFFREARAAARLQHRNIVTIFEFAEEDGVPYIVMEFLRGRSLAARMATSPPLTLVDKLDVVEQLCTGLHFAHSQGVIHRDVKPANVWLQDDGTVRLLDFGIAKLTTGTGTHGSDFMGSAPYMSPEQIEGKRVDGRADIFSAGVVLYELLAGQRPFCGDSPTAVMMHIVNDEPVPIGNLVADLPHSLVGAVQRVMQKDPNSRYASADALAAELRFIRRSLLVSENLASGSATGSTETGTLATTAALDGANRTRTGHSGDLSTTREAGVVEAGRIDSPRNVWFRGWPGGRRWPLAVAVAAVVLAIAGTATWLGRNGSAATAVRQSATQPAVQIQPSTALVNTATPTVRIVTDPPGAAISLDGRSLGVTPASIPVSTEGPLRLNLMKKGYMSAIVTLSVDQIRTGSASYRLESAIPVKFVATGDYDFQVREGQRLLSDTGRHHEIPLVGRHVVRLVAPEYLLDFPVSVDPSKGPTVEATAPDLGLLKVILQGAWRYCRTSVAGRDLGEHPIADRSVAPGSHIVTVECQDGQRQEQRVKVEPNKTAGVLFR